MDAVSEAVEQIFSPIGARYVLDVSGGDINKFYIASDKLSQNEEYWLSRTGGLLTNQLLQEENLVESGRNAFVSTLDIGMFIGMKVVKHFMPGESTEKIINDLHQRYWWLVNDYAPAKYDELKFYQEKTLEMPAMADYGWRLAKPYYEPVITSWDYELSKTEAAKPFLRRGFGFILQEALHTLRPPEPNFNEVVQQLTQDDT